MNPERLQITKGPDEKEQLMENAVMVETEDAKFRILYAIHTTEQRAEELGSADALVLETAISDYSTSQKAIDLFLKKREDMQYRKLIKEAKEQKRSVFFADIADSDFILMLQLILRNSEGYAGLALLVNSACSSLIKKNITRRTFLKNSLVGLSGLYFSTQLPSSLLSGKGPKRTIDEKSMGRIVRRFFDDLNNRIHPEASAILLTLRNDVIAQKMETIARTQFPNLGRKPEIAVAIGGAHTGIENSFSKGHKERVESIRKLLQIPGLDETRKKIATIARIDYKDNEDAWRVKIFRDNYLAPLEQAGESKKQKYKEEEAIFLSPKS